jgi:hypothetical protein
MPSLPSIRPINRVWDPPRTVSPQRPPIIGLHSLVMGVTSSPWCDQCRLPADGRPSSGRHAPLSTRGIANQHAAQALQPGKFVSIPRRPLAAGDHAGYLACLDSLHPLRLVMYRYVGHSAVTPLTICDHLRAAAERTLWRCMISAAL